MEKQAINNEVLRIMGAPKVGTLSTIKGDQPFARYMIFRSEGFVLYTISSKRTDKVQDIQNNSKVHILLGFESGGHGQPYIDMTAKATIHDDKNIKDRFWHDNFRKYLEGPDDPNYIVIKCTPISIRLMNHPELDGPYTLDFT